MKTPGSNDVEYGQPAAAENHIRRKLADNTPETSLFSIWHSPIENQRRQ